MKIQNLCWFSFVCYLINVELLNCDLQSAFLVWKIWLIIQQYYYHGLFMMASYREELFWDKKNTYVDEKFDLMKNFFRL